MKTFKFFLAGTVATFISFCSLASPLDNWHWRNPLPNGNPQLGAQTLNDIVYAAGKFVAVGDSGVVSISIDSTNWSQSATATTNNLNGLIYTNSEFVAVGNGGVVETSSDGTNWVVQDSGTTDSLSAIAYGSGKFVAVGPSAVISSANLIDWIPATSGLTGATTVAGGSNGFVALGSYANKVYFSPDGLSWSSETFTVPSVPDGYTLENEIATYWNGMYLVGGNRYAGEQSAECFIFTSTDGSHWATNDLGVQSANDGFFNYNFFMTGSYSLIAGGEASATSFLQFSPDGTHWSQTNYPSTLGAGGPNYGPVAGAYGNGTYALIGWDTSTIYTSQDGINWTNRNYIPPASTGPTYTFTCIASNSGVDVAVSANLVGISSNGLSYVVASNTPALSSILSYSNGFVGVGPGGAIDVSTNGLSWTQRNSGTANNLYGIATSGNGLLAAVGDGGTIQTSPSGLIWTSRTSGTSLSLYSVICSNGIFVAVGQEGTVLTSPDGINWSGQYSGALSNLLSVTYGWVGFVAVGPGGTIVSSLDGTNWVTQSPGTSASFESVTFGNGYYLAAGNNGVAMTSPDGVNWTARNLGLTGGQNLYGSAFINNRFDVVGANGTIIESDVIAPLFDLQIAGGAGQNGFTMFATPGTSFHLQGCTSLGSSWSNIASFNNVTAITQWTNSQAEFNQQFFRLISP